MSSSADSVHNHINVLQVDVDPGDYISQFRVLVDGKTIKYLTIDPGTYSVEDMCWDLALIPQLPKFPPGDWNQGHIALDDTTGFPCFVEVTKSELPEITKLWHPLIVDYLDLELGEELRSNIYEAKLPRHFNDDIVVVKFAAFPWETGHLDAETTAYEWIEGQDIGPKFLGHLSEHGRVMGFIIEKIPQARRAGPEDLASCQEALLKLHRLGIKHGDINRHNFMITSDGSAKLIDFDAAVRFSGGAALEGELLNLEAELEDESGRGGVIVTEPSD